MVTLSFQSESKRAKTTQSFIVHDRVPERKVFPELPLPSTEGDKLKQHEDDIETAKRKLREMRERKMEENRRQEKEKRELKRQRSSNKESATSPAASPENFRMKPRKEKPPKPTSVIPKEKAAEKRSTATTPSIEPSSKPAKKKLTLSDLSDEDEVSDWSDTESPSVRKKMRKRAEESSNSNSGASTPVHQTRKASLQVQADAVLRSDPATPNFTHFCEEEVETAAGQASSLGRFLADEGEALSVSSLGSDDLDGEEDFIYLDGLESPKETSKYGTS